jgi:ATP-dependent RNA helicase DDX3X
MTLNVFYKGSEIARGHDEVTTFAEHKFDDILLNNIETLKFSQMTPIQRSVVPFIVQRNDVMACSQTGSGKTVAFLAPTLNRMLKDGPPKDDGFRGSAPVVLILIPTRELAEQIHKEARKLVHKTGISVVKVYGGVEYNTQISEVKDGCDILVATPGRLIDFLTRELIKLSCVRYLVIDEADRILDMGFEEQLRKIMYDFGKI